MEAQASFPYLPRYYNGPALYVYFTNDCKCMYVGITNTLCRRTVQHLFHKKDNLRKQVQSKYWWMWWREMDAELLELVEAQMIKRLNPLYNRTHKLSVRAR